MIHAKGPRSNKPFVAVNCGAIPTELMESEFFGHKKGSFTGATADKEGLFQAADGGTLFFDEVADLPLHMQVKLLRAIQEKAIRPVGAQKEMKIDVRILSATHKNLETLVEEGNFRQDLYYRINVIELAVPPLREHPEDIAQLTDQFLLRLNGEDAGASSTISEDALDQLKQYPFPGNVRELENILERALALCEGNVIKPEDLQLPRMKDIEPRLETVIAVGDGISLESQLITIERNAILDALEKTSHNKTAAAKLLGMSFRSLRYRLKKLGLE